MVAWMVYALVVSALVSVAAWLAERGARAAQWPGRWVWTAALAVSIIAPLVGWLVPRTGPAESGLAAVPGDYVLQTIPLSAAPVASSSGPALGTLLVWGWILASALLLAALTVLAVRLHRRRRGWPARVVDGVEVLVSPATGPAAIGIARGRVVVPEWALALAAPQRRLLVLHEAEHVWARDPQLALVGLLVCALAPWNLPLWWQLRRLRAAIEVDCDARVLRHSAEPHLYGSLLLAVGQRRSHLALALVESPSSLERRIRMIVENGKGRAVVRGGLLLALSGVVLALACETPGPSAPASPEPQEVGDEAVQDAPSADELAEAAPTFTPMTVRPQVTNVEEVRQALESQYPPVLRDAGIGGRAHVWFLIDETGRVVKRQINQSSGHDALDAAALRVAERMAFTPAYNGDDPVPVWVSLVITFEATEPGEPERDEPQPEPQPEPRSQPVTTPEGVEGDPTFTPMTVRPEVTNSEAVREALQTEYPPMLRDAGIGGTAHVWFYIDETGTVRDLRVNDSSGYPALDAAALRVADLMAFTPAYNGEEPAAVWVSIAIHFEVPEGGAEDGRDRSTMPPVRIF